MSHGGFRSRLLRLVPLAVLAGGLLVALSPPAAQAANVTPTAACPAGKPGVTVVHNDNGFVDQGAQYTVTATVFPGTSVTVIFERAGTGVEIFRHVTPTAGADGALSDTANLEFIPAGTTVLPFSRYVCKDTGQVKGWNSDLFTMQPPPDPCEINPDRCIPPCGPFICTSRPGMAA
jgi:hypothetical protein